MVSSSICRSAGSAMNCSGVSDIDLLQHLVCSALISYFFLNDSHGHLNKEIFDKCRHIIHLHITNNTFDMDTDAFEYLADVRVLLMEETVSGPFAYLPENAFQKNTKLVKLYLRGNNFADIGPGTFKGQKELVILDLSNNLINKLEPGTFSSNNRLQKLNLSKNKLTHIRSGVFRFNDSSKASLNLSHNSISQIDGDAFVNCPTLGELDISHNRVQHMDFLFEGVSSVVRVDVSHNRLTRLPPMRQFRKLPKLKNIDFTFNGIVTVGRELPLFLSGRPVQFELRGNRVRCECGPVKDAYDEAKRLNVSLDLSCASGRPWDDVQSLACAVASEASTHNARGREGAEDQPTGSGAGSGGGGLSVTVPNATETGVGDVTQIPRSSSMAPTVSSSQTTTTTTTYIPEMSRSTYHSSLSVNDTEGMIDIIPVSEVSNNQGDLAHIGTSIILGSCAVVLIVLILCGVIYAIASWCNKRGKNRTQFEQPQDTEPILRRKEKTNSIV